MQSAAFAQRLRSVDPGREAAEYAAQGWAAQAAAIRASRLSEERRWAEVTTREIER